MPSGVINGVGIPSSAAGWTGGTNVHAVMGIPDGRPCANGLRPVAVLTVGVYASGRGAARTAVVSVGGGNSGQFPLGAGGSAAYGVYGINGAYFPGTQQTTLSIDTDGAFYYGRASVPGVDLYEGGSVAYSGSALPGYFSYAEAPAAPTMLSATPLPGGRVEVQFTAGDDGGAPATGYILQYASRADFADAIGIPSTGTSVLQLQPGIRYYFRACTRNQVTDAYGTYSQWATPISAVMRSGGKVRAGGAWRTAQVKVRVAGAWRDAVIKVRSGGAWKDGI